MSRRAPRLAPEAAGPIRAAFEPRYGYALSDDQVEEIASSFRRFHDVLAAWDAEDRAGLGVGRRRATSTPQPGTDHATPQATPIPPPHPESPPTDPPCGAPLRR